MNFYKRKYIINDNRNGKICYEVDTSTRNELLSISAFPRAKAVHPFFHLESFNEFTEYYGRYISTLDDKTRTDIFIECYLEPYFNRTYCSSVWNFYNKINWDYKKKKWINPSISKDENN